MCACEAQIPRYSRGGKCPPRPLDEPCIRFYIINEGKEMLCVYIYRKVGEIIVFDDWMFVGGIDRLPFL